MTVEPGAQAPTVLGYRPIARGRLGDGRLAPAVATMMHDGTGGVSVMLGPPPHGRWAVAGPSQRLDLAPGGLAEVTLSKRLDVQINARIEDPLTLPLGKTTESSPRGDVHVVVKRAEGGSLVRLAWGDKDLSGFVLVVVDHDDLTQRNRVVPLDRNTCFHSSHLIAGHTYTVVLSSAQRTWAAGYMVWSGTKTEIAFGALGKHSKDAVMQ